jgi:choline dehydrogenase
VTTRRRFLTDAAAVLGLSAAWRGVALAGETPSGAFDFIIVGAGSAGCVLANRLSGDPDTRVLLVEAGGQDSYPAIEQPGQWTRLLGTELDWAYPTTPEEALEGRALTWPRGRVLGGSSTINAMSYARGHRLNFDRWAELADDSWAYREVLPLFKGLEDNSRGASEYLGAGGPLAVSDTTDPHAGHLAFLEAARALGFDARPDWDFNGAQQENGAGFYQKNIKHGRRHSAAAAFLAPVVGRPNLTVWTHTVVHRLLTEGTRAAGVLYARDGRVGQVRARRGVILSAGAIASPQILMLSGIGPAADLRRHGIAVLADAPGVGENLQDRLRTAVRWQGRTELPASSVSAGLFTWSTRATTASPPDVQFYVGRGVDAPDPFITLTVAVGAPRSRGTVRLRSADPTMPPVIRPNYLEEPHDLDVLVDGVRLARALGETKAYEALRGALLEPGPDARSDNEVRAFIRRTADTIYHPAGTCRMGRDPASVVDPQLRVRGVERLWVADASVMPELVNAQIHAACLLIAERLASTLRDRNS